MQAKKLFKYTASLLLPVALISMAGCATIINGKTQQVSFNSEPQGAEVIVDGTSVGVTPVTASIQRGGQKMVSVKKDGYQTAEATLTSSTSGAFWGNIIIGGLPGSTTDGATGSMYEFTPGEVMVTLSPN